METPPPKPKQDRDAAFDIAKGVGIIAVVGLHLTNRSARLFHDPYSAGWWTLTWINRFLNFCVPLFLLLSAILLSRSIGAKANPDWGRFFVRRLRSIVIPLVVWSVLYWLMRVFIQHDPHVLTAGFWLAVKPRLTELLLGKAKFHLYFLSILWQFCVLLPVLILIVRATDRLKTGIWGAVVIAVLLQAAMFALQKIVKFDYPGSTVFWYLSTLIPGVWVGLHWSDWTAVRSRTWVLWAIVAVAGFAVFGYETRLDLLKLHPDGTVMNAAASTYALGMPFLIFGLITIWKGGSTSLREFIRRLGVASMQIYLMHPILLQLLSKPLFLKVFKVLPLPSLWFFLATLLGSYAGALVLDRIPKANVVLFGKE